MLFGVSCSENVILYSVIVTRNLTSEMCLLLTVLLDFARCWLCYACSCGPALCSRLDDSCFELVYEKECWMRDRTDETLWRWQDFEFQELTSSILTLTQTLFCTYIWQRLTRFEPNSKELAKNLPKGNLQMVLISASVGIAMVFLFMLVIYALDVCEQRGFWQRWGQCYIEDRQFHSEQRAPFYTTNNKIFYFETMRPKAVVYNQQTKGDN